MPIPDFAAEMGKGKGLCSVDPSPTSAPLLLLGLLLVHRRRRRNSGKAPSTAA